MAEQSLKEKTAKGLFWGGLSNGVQQLLNLFFGIFLSRILNAEDYGMVGMLSIFSLIAGSLQESGFTAALANKRNISHKDYNAVFWFSTGLSACLYLILFLCAPLIAEFYHTPELTALARYTFLGFFVASLGIAIQCLPVPQLNGQAKGNGGHYRINRLRNYRYNYGLLGICLLGDSHTKHCLCRNH